jgi:hypothetical protein
VVSTGPAVEGDGVVSVLCQRLIGNANGVRVCDLPTETAVVVSWE